MAFFKGLNYNPSHNHSDKQLQKSLWASEVILKVTSLTRKYHYVYEIVEVIVVESCGSSQLLFPEPTGCSKQISNSITCQSREDEDGRCRQRKGECQCRLDGWQTGGDVDVFIGLSTEPTEPLQGANCFHSDLNGWKVGGWEGNRGHIFHRPTAECWLMEIITEAITFTQSSSGQLILQCL